MSSHPSHIPPTNYYEEDEITLKDIILTVQEYSKELFKNIHWIVLSSLLVAGAFYYLKRGSANRTTYTSNLSFLVKESSNGVKAQAASPELIQLGIGGSISNNKLIELAQSGVTINQVLLTKVTINDKNDFLGNHLIDIYGYQYLWNNEPIAEEYKELRLKDFYFSHNNINDFKPREYRALSILRELIVGPAGIFSIAHNQGSGSTKLEAISPNDKLSLKMIDLMFQTLKSLFIEETIGRSQRNYSLLVARVDSLEKALRIAQMNQAKATDQTYGLISKASLLRIGKLNEEVDRISTLYRSFLDKRQVAEFALRSETPEFMVIDRTFLPIKKTTSITLGLIISAIIGFFLGMGIIIFRKIIRDALAE